MSDKRTTFTIPRDGATNEVQLEIDRERGLITLRQTVFGITDTVVITREQAAKVFAKCVDALRNTNTNQNRI